MASDGRKEIFQANDRNTKKIKKLCDGKFELQNVAMAKIDAWCDARAVDSTAFVASGGTPPADMSLCFQLVDKRRQSQAKVKKRKDTSNTGPLLGGDGAHQPRHIPKWVNAPGPLQFPNRELVVQRCNIANWGPKHFGELFAYCEPSLFASFGTPTESIMVLQQLFERAFRLNTGIIPGQVPGTLA